MEHIQNLHKLILSLEAMGECIAQGEKLTVFLGSLSDAYDQIKKIIENIHGVDILQAKEVLRRGYEAMRKTESNEVASRATKYRNKSSNQNVERDEGLYKMDQVKRSYCNKVGHMKSDCWKVKRKTNMTLQLLKKDQRVGF